MSDGGLTETEVAAKAANAPDALLRLWARDSRRWVRELIRREQRRRAGGSS